MAYRTITITSNQPPKEGKASGTIYPGMALYRTSTADQVAVHNVQQGKIHGNLVAIEDELQGNGIADAYSTTNRILFRSFLPGDEVYLKIKSGQNISIGDKLVSGGNGYFEKERADSSAVDDVDSFAVALEACNATAGTAMCRAEVS